MVVGRLTELDAVNKMLAVIGESPINTLTGELTGDVILAKNTLDRVTREVQGRSWDFNSEYNYPLAPTIDNEIVLPSNLLRVDITGYDPYDAVERNGKLYSRQYRTTTCFTTAVNVDMTLLYQFNEIPEAAKNYIMIRAAREFADNSLTSTEIHGYTAQDELRAYADLMDAHAESADFSMFDHPDVGQIVYRQTGNYLRY